MATSSNRFMASNLRIRRRRFVRKNSLPIFAFLILTIPALILLPGYRLRSPAKTIEVDSLKEVLPPPHPPQQQSEQQHRHVQVERARHSQSHKTVQLEEDGHADQLTIHPVAALNISLVVLFHNEYPTLNHTLHSWGNLVPHISEILFFLNGVETDTEFRENLPILRQPQFAHFRVHTSPKNLALGLAITEMVRQAKHDVVLLLEKDWALIEDNVADVLATGARLLDNGVHVVRLRHRDYPGAPLHARMMHDGREESILKEQKNLFCYVHHWISNPVDKYPEHFSVCPTLQESDAVWCAKARYCQWTNNPALFKKEWFLAELGEPFENEYQTTHAAHPSSHMLDFEFYTNWKGEVWNDRDFTVALPKGLFEHQEISEGGVMNTVWYAWNRLQKDVDDKRKDYLEQAQASCEGRDVRPDEGLWQFKERYPLDFVRHYSYPDAMKRTMAEGVAELHNETMRIRDRMEGGHGTWRNGVTDLTNLWYKICLFVYPSEPADMNLGFVTALYHTETSDDGGLGSRAEVDTAAANIDALSNYYIAVYCTESTKKTLEQSLKEGYKWSADQFSRLKVITEELETLLERLLSTENIKRIKELRGGDTYQERVRNRTQTLPSEQALALAHTKPYILDDAIDHLTVATHLMWFDAASPCIAMGKGESSGKNGSINAENDAILRSQLFLHGFVTGVPVTGEEELESAMTGSGFSAAVFLRHMEKASGTQLKFIDMKSIGGSRMAVALLTGYYDSVLRDLLRQGQLGTGREAMSIARNNVDYHFRFFDALNGCPENLSGTHACGRKLLEREYMKDNLASCQLYRWIGECNARLSNV